MYIALTITTCKANNLYFNIVGIYTYKFSLIINRLDMIYSKLLNIINKPLPKAQSVIFF